jgi:hypothetical protein
VTESGYPVVCHHGTYFACGTQEDARELAHELHAPSVVNMGLDACREFGLAFLRRAAERNNRAGVAQSWTDPDVLERAAKLAGQADAARAVKP